jgi:hypothetical protein
MAVLFIVFFLIFNEYIFYKTKKKNYFLTKILNEIYFLI